MVNVYKSIVVCFVCFPQIKVAPGSRNSAWVSFDGRNRQEIKQGDRYETIDKLHILPKAIAMIVQREFFIAT